MFKLNQQPLAAKVSSIDFSHREKFIVKQENGSSYLARLVASQEMRE